MSRRRGASVSSRSCMPSNLFLRYYSAQINCTPSHQRCSCCRPLPPVCARWSSDEVWSKQGKLPCTLERAHQCNNSQDSIVTIVEIQFLGSCQLLVSPTSVFCTKNNKHSTVAGSLFFPPFWGVRSVCCVP